MKRYFILFTVTLLAAATIMTTGNSIKNSILKINVMRIEPVQEVEYVTCTGQVERSSIGNVYAPNHSVSDKIYVREGEKVKAGQALMTVKVYSDEENTAGTYAAYAEQNNGSSSEQTINAPVSGTVSSIAVLGSGYYVDPTEPAVVIQNPTELQVRLEVNESQVTDLKAGQQAKITGSGFKNSCYAGVVKEISSEAKQIATLSGQETVVEVLVSVEDAKEDIKPGFTAKAKIITSSDSSVLVAPYSAVQADQDGREYVLRVVQGKAVKTPIETGREFDSGFEVKSGISLHDQIVTDAEKISDGVRIVPVLSKAVDDK
ncbi:MAG: HlyD family efflux transporter periplasmic adaptor subunit [Oscillospiraceae bacterium]|nr:HlyD family efflux transporter periplasmic adaptor subunit [Oscillospiraceae bacterium]